MVKTKSKNTPYNQRVVLHPDGYPTTIGALKKLGLWSKKGGKMKYYECTICKKRHQYDKPVSIIVDGQRIKTTEPHSPCLDEILRKATGAINSLVKGGE